MSDTDRTETGKERFAGFDFDEGQEERTGMSSPDDMPVHGNGVTNGKGGEPQATGAGSSPADDRLSVRSVAVGIWNVLFRQQGIFGRPFEGRWDRRALAFSMIVTALIPLLQQAMLYVLLPVLDVVLPDSIPMIAVADYLPQRLSLMGLVRDAFIIPLLIPVPLALYAAVLHGLLRLAQSGERGYAVTFQTVCYAQACWLLSIMPGSGGYVAILWWLGVLAAGLHYGHRSPWHRVLPVMALHVSASAWLVALANGWVLSPF